MTPTQLVNNVLLGGGIAVSNITYSGSANAIGSFDGSACNVGIASGVLLTSGTVLDTGDGPHGPNTQGGSGTDNSQGGHPLLAAAAGNPSFNAATLEFDFIPVSDSVHFNYVFASEEYLEFVNSGVNDAFGFFISGPNPLGGSYTDKNIALIPGTTTPITIDNVNAGLNAAYYIDNGDGMTAPYNGSSTYIQYDGLTTLMTAEEHVICGQSYHIIITISDIGDGVFDSGVFLEGGSFSSPGVDISSELSFQGNAANDSTLFEGCTDATLWFVRNDSIPFMQTFPLTLSGTATNGVDYSGLPSSIVFPAGQDSTSVVINALFDNLLEGLETIQINISIPSACASMSSDSIIIYIQDVDELTVDLPDETVQCPGMNVILDPVVAGGNPNYEYLWNTGETSQTIQVNPATSTSYSVTVTDTCGQIASDTVLVNIIVALPLTVDARSDTLIHCTNQTINLGSVVTGGYGGNTFLWNTSETTPQITVQVNATSTYTIIVTDQCGYSESDSATITVQEIPMFISASPDITVCKGTTVTLEAIATGGYGNVFDYQWSSGQTTAIIDVTPTSTTTYIVGVADACGLPKAWDTVVVNIIDIQANFLAPGPFEENLPIQFTNTSSGATSYQWEFGNNSSSTQLSPTIVYDEDGNYTVMLIATNDENGCVDTTYRIIVVNPEFFFYMPNSFTPDGDEFNNTFKPKGTPVHEYTMQIFDRWGELLFVTHDIFTGWDGTYRGSQVQSGTYIYKVVVTNLRYEVKEFFGHVNL
ncbi:MAG: gliding motility-associated-like protein, partial [Crocinitomicaceae bacterium]